MGYEPKDRFVKEAAIVVHLGIYLRIGHSSGGVLFSVVKYVFSDATVPIDHGGAASFYGVARGRMQSEKWEPRVPGARK